MSDPPVVLGPEGSLSVSSSDEETSGESWVVLLESSSDHLTQSDEFIYSPAGSIDAREDGVLLEDSVPLRRSARASAGHHSNPYRLLRSVAAGQPNTSEER